MPSQSHSTPSALLPLGFSLTCTQLHKYCRQTWSMAAWASGESVPEPLPRRTMPRIDKWKPQMSLVWSRGMETMDKLADKEVSWLSCRAWKPWSPAENDCWETMKERCSFVLTEQANRKEVQVQWHLVPWGKRLEPQNREEKETSGGMHSFPKLLCSQKSSDYRSAKWKWRQQ